MKIQKKVKKIEFAPRDARKGQGIYVRLDADMLDAVERTMAKYKLSDRSKTIREMLQYAIRCGVSQA